MKPRLHLLLLWTVALSHGLLHHPPLTSTYPRPPCLVARAQKEDGPRGVQYYRGLLTSIGTNDDASKDMLTPSLKLAGGASVLLVALVTLFLVANFEVPPVAAASESKFEARGITALDTIVFIIGTVPFVWAGNEFWRRIAAGKSFGTGSDSIVINPTVAADEDQIRRFGGRRVLGPDAVIAARFLFGLAAASVALTVVAALQL